MVTEKFGDAIVPSIHPSTIIQSINQIYFHMVCTGCKQWCWLHKPIRLWDNSRLLLFICCPLHFNTLKLNFTNIATKNNFHWLLGGVVAKNACFIYLWIDYHREYQGKLPLFSPHSFTTQQNVLLREICFFYLCLLPLNPSHMCLLISIAQLKESTLLFILAHHHHWSSEWIVGIIWSLIMVVLLNPATHTCWLA